MYFSLLPDIKYDTKPIKYPFSESDFVTAKNFFRRYTISEDAFGYATFYNKYSVNEGVSIEQIAAEYYGNAFYDWVIILTNNFINPLFAFPLDNYTLGKYIEEKYGLNDQGDSIAYSKIHHYETIETKSGRQVDGIDVVVLKFSCSLDFLVDPNLLPELSQSRLGKRFTFPSFSVKELIIFAISIILVSSPVARLYASPSTPDKAQEIKPSAISSTKIKSLDDSPSFSRGRASLFKAFHIKVGITFLQTVLGVPLHRPAPNNSPGP